MFVDASASEKLVASLQKEGVAGSVIGELVPHESMPLGETNVDMIDGICALTSGNSTGKRIHIDIINS
jgi:hypothetical protein